MSTIKNKNTNVKLNKAKKDKNDEFYTQYADIEKEIGAYLSFNPDLFKDVRDINKADIYRPYLLFLN